MPKTTETTKAGKAKSKRGRKPNLLKGETMHGYPIIVLPLVSPTDKHDILGYDVYPLNLPSIGTVRIRSANIQAAFKKVLQHVFDYLKDCEKNGVAPTPPTLHGDLIPAPLSDDLTRRQRLFAEIEAEALLTKKAASFTSARLRSRGKRSKVQAEPKHETEWHWGTTAEEVAVLFGVRHPELPEADKDEITRHRRGAAYRGIVVGLLGG